LKDSSQKRHIAKTITWRFIGTIDTILLSWVITGNPYIALKIGGAEVITKMLLYYFHERIWFKIDFSESSERVSRLRHFLKTLSWRVIGTVDTMMLAWVISGNPLIGLKVGLVEVITKMLLYYIHERLWYKLDYGLNQRHQQTKSV
jgi:uncharacterized membrane protein